MVYAVFMLCLWGGEGCLCAVYAFSVIFQTEVLDRVTMLLC